MDKNKIRVLLGSTLFTESKGGGEIYCEYLMKALQTRGHEVKIISGRDIMNHNINEKERRIYSRITSNLGDRKKI